MAQLNFDATQVAPDTGLEPVPAGWYNVMIDESEMKPTKDGSGAYLQVRFNVIDGQFQGRKLFARLNLRNANPTAQEIAFKQLSAIAHAVGVLHVQDSQQLHGIPLKVKVKLRKDTTGQYDDSNEISSYKNINEQVEMPGVSGGAPQGGAPQGGFQPPQAPAGFGGAPQGGGFQQPPAQQPAPPQQWAPPQQPQQAPQQPAQQPWGQQPPQQPQPQQPQQPDPSQQAWQQPQQAQQPWQQPAQQPAPQQAAPAPAQQQAPAQQPQQPAQQHPAQSATPPWAQGGQQ